MLLVQKKKGIFVGGSAHWWVRVYPVNCITLWRHTEEVRWDRDVGWDLGVHTCE